VSDHNNNAVRKLTSAVLPCTTCWGCAPLCAEALSRRTAALEQGVETLAGGSFGFADGAAVDAKFRYAAGIATSPDGTWLAVSDRNNNRIRKVRRRPGSLKTARPSARGGPAGPVCISPCMLAREPQTARSAAACSPLTPARRAVQVVVSTGAVTTLCGREGGGFADGEAGAASFSGPTGLSFSPNGDWIAVADTGNHAIRRVPPLSY